MIVKCPKCNAQLRLKKTTGEEVLVRCPRCQSKVRVQAKSFFTTLIAHEDQEICQQLSERVTPLGSRVVVCRDENAIRESLVPNSRCVLLLDVAFNGIFPFQVIDKIKAAGQQQHKVVLLPSVYNRTAYKKSPDSLYGADAYLELHHIGDRLVPLIGELYPELLNHVASIAPVCTDGDERKLQPDELVAQANKLAKLLVADIVLYHQDRLEQGQLSGQLEQLFAEQLEEGRRLLGKRLPAAADLPIDFIKQAFDTVCKTYSRN